ncbi:MAG: DMT family transporter [Janthinobacterium lividum]
MTRMQPASGRAPGFAACALASTFWGCGFFFGKIALAEMNVGAMVFYRFAFAAIGLLPLLFTHRPRFDRREWTWLLLGSFLGIPLQFLLQFRGLSLTTVSHASLMVGTMPVILAVGATVFAKEKLHTLGWVALVISTIGAALIAFSGAHRVATAGGPSLAGDLLVVASMLIALFWILINQRLIVKHSSVVVSVYGLFTGFAMLAVCVPLLYGLPPVHGITWKAWVALAGSGLLCTASTTLLWNWGMTRVPASQAGVLLNIEPLMGSILGVALLHDRLGGWAYLGGGMIVLAALTLTTRSSTTMAEVPEPPTMM